MDKLVGWSTREAGRLEYSPVEKAYQRVHAVKARLINLASGNPDPTIVPIRELQEIAGDVFNIAGYDALVYPGTGGLEELRREIRRFMERSGISLSSGYEIVVTSGAQHAFKLLSEVLVDENVVVVCESPTFYETLAPLKLRAGRVLGVGFRGGRLDLGSLDGFLMGSSRTLLYTIPTCHNPTGFTMDEDDRRQLLEIAYRYDSIVIEDDPYRSFSSRPPPALVSLDGESRVVYVGTLSKILAPGLRIGWVAAPPELAERISLLENYDIAISTLTQHIALEALRRGLVEDTAAKLRGHYSRKRRVMEEALEDYMPPEVSWEPGECGLFQLIDAHGFDAENGLPTAIERGVIYVPAKLFFIPDGSRGSIRLSLGPSSEEEIVEGIHILAEVIREALD